MSKESFSKKILDNVYRNMIAIFKDGDLSHVSFDRNFILALTLTYLALSKDKIIKKEKKNNNRLERITKNVSTIDIETLFNQINGPEVLYSLEDDKTWILDNIRDSIMHEKIDIEENNGEVIVKNDFEDRELGLIIPFNWFTDYMKADILSKRKTNYFSKKGIYYNNYVNKDKKFDLLKTINSSIIYKIDVEGEELNIKKLNDIIEKTLDKCSKEEMINGSYYKSFYSSKLKLKEEILKEYPDSKIRISTDKKKQKIKEKAEKKFYRYYNDYDQLYYDISSLFERKSTAILNAFRDVFDYICHDYDEDNIFEKLNDNISVGQRQALTRELYYVFLYVYGVNSIVINKGSLLNDEYLENFDGAISKVGIKGQEDYAKQRRDKLGNYLKKIDIEQKFLTHYERCGENSKEKLKEIYLNCKEETLKAEKEYYMSFYSTVLVPKKKLTKKPLAIRDYIVETVRDTISKYKNISDESLKDEYKKLIFDLEESMKNLEAHYFYGKVDGEEILRIIRNSLSHVGRVEIINSDPSKPELIVFNDYDDNGIQTGRVVYKLVDFIEVLSNSYVLEEDNPKTLQNKKNML